MKEKTSFFFRKQFWIPLLILFLLVVSISYERNVSKLAFTDEDIEDFQSVFNQKERQLELLFSQVESILKDSSINAISSFPYSWYRLKENEGLILFLYRADSLFYWSDNSLSLPSNVGKVPPGELVRLGNGIYSKKGFSTKNIRGYGLILIKTEYPYENKFLKNHFQEDFHASSDIKIVQQMKNRKNEVNNLSGQYLFSLDTRQAEHQHQSGKIICLVLYLVCISLFLMYMYLIVKGASLRKKNLILLLYIPLFALLYYAFIWFRLPEILFDIPLFSPAKYAYSAILPSLGDLLILSVLAFFLAYIFYLEFKLRTSKTEAQPGVKNGPIFIFSLALLLIYFFNAFIFRSLILDSSISFETYKVLDITIYTFIGFLVLILLFATFGILADKIFRIISQTGNKTKAKRLLYLLCLIFALPVFFPGAVNITIETAVFYTIFLVFIYYFRFERRKPYRFSTFVVFVLFFSVFSVYEVVKYSEFKHLSEMKMFAVNLSTEHDPVAELLLEDIDKKMKQDTILETIIRQPDFDFKDLYAYVQRNYFSGYWDKYDLQLTLCNPKDSVFVSPPENTWYHCYNFFYEYIMEDGTQVPGTDYYFLDNLNGRISYFSSIGFEVGTKNEVSLFIELDSRLISEGLGYPELLLEDNMTDSYGNYSYAKYHNHRLITSMGDFAYAMSIVPYTQGREGFESIKYDRYDHKIYHVDFSNTIIVSKPSLFWIDLLISFSYTFIFYFIILIVLLAITRIIPFSLRFRWDFKNKIQIAMTSLLLISLVLIGAGTVYFSIKQYKNRQIEILNEKMQSVYVELTHKLEFETDLHSWTAQGYYHLNELLQKFSNVFYSDINLYDEKGQLLATSRPEIFEKGLIGEKMNALAYREMAINHRSEYIHSESVGKLNYLSSYVPFVNSDNKLLAYLNLPYFSRQDELTREVTNILVAIINIVVILSLLSFTIAVFLSNRITHPLRLLQENLARISLSEKNERISYSGNDEIGNLVREYNQMVEQLIYSAELLARSERESAWREMAKQIAHEIKNPLTPMRLGIQHLQRLWGKQGKDSDEQSARIMKTFLEQIENLSSIATEFSNFAKMPLANNEKVNLHSVIEDTVSLFSEYENTAIEVDPLLKKEMYVYADKEQLNRVFINLIKNAIQSIPDDREGLITIQAEIKSGHVTIMVEDNGKGIEEDIRGRLFQPNFTTKSSGMGLGLAISQNIVRNAGGRIYYQTETGKGTRFFVLLPLLK